MKEKITEVEQEDIITNNNLLLYFSGHNNDLLVPKTMESCILKTKTKKQKKQTKAQKINPNENKKKKRIKALLLNLPRRHSSRDEAVKTFAWQGSRSSAF